MKKTEEVKPIQDSQRSIWTTWKINVKKLSGRACRVLQAMAMLGQGGIEKTIVDGILMALAADDDGKVQGMFRKVIVEELMHGSSLISHDERGEEERRIYKMNRLVRLFVLNNMRTSSTMWHYVYKLALLAVHERLQTELEKEGSSFYNLPDVLGNNHCEFAAHSLALVYHHDTAKELEVQEISAVEDIHRYSGMVMRFMGKSEEVQVWKNLLAISASKQTVNRRESSIHCLLDMWHRQRQGKEAKSRIANIHNSLGIALMSSGELGSAATQLKKTWK